MGILAFRKMEDVQVSGTQKAILLYLAIRAYDERDFQTFVSMSKIVKQTCFARRTVYKVLAELEALGLISSTLSTVSNESRQKVISRRVNVDHPLADGALSAPDEQPARGAPDAQNEGQGVHLMHKGGAPDAQRGCTTCTEEVHDMHKGGAPDAPIKTNNNYKNPKDARERARGGVWSDFVSVWVWAPLEAKRAAQHLFEKMSEADRADAIEQAEAFQKAWAKQGFKKQIFAKTYLKERRWEDLGQTDAPSQVWIAEGSGAWEAWRQADKGKMHYAFKRDLWRDRESAGGFWVPSGREFPENFPKH